MNAFETIVSLSSWDTIVYEPRRMRKALRKGAAIVRKEARRLVSRRAVSAPNDYPGAQSGAMKRAIGVVAKGSGGGWIRVSVKAIPSSAFYPAFLHHGSVKTGLEPRKNFIVDALEAKRNTIREGMRTALKESIRKQK